MMKLLLVALAVPAALSLTLHEAEFNQWMDVHSQTFTSQQDYDTRLAIFSANVEEIARLNQEAKGETTFALNKFAHLTPQEFSRMYKGYKQTSRDEVETVAVESVTASGTTDWSKKGYTTPVKDQAQCGSCWAFSTTEAVETAWFMAGHKLVSLSPQQIVSCDKGRGDEGCNGGDTPTAYDYVEAAGGLELERDYPYTSGGGANGKCKFNAAEIAANITSFKYVSKDAAQEKDMVSYVNSKGPLSICLATGGWQFYSGGVLKKSKCGREVDHCVQVVGINNDQGYWIVRNSWNTDWGEKGYIWIEEGVNACDIAGEATYAVSP